MCPRAGYHAPCYLSEFLLCSWITRLFHPYSGLHLLVLQNNSSRLLLPLVLFTSTLALFLSSAFSSETSIHSKLLNQLSLRISQRSLIKLWVITPFQRNEQHSGRVYFSLLRYIPLFITNAQCFAVTLPMPL